MASPHARSMSLNFFLQRLLTQLPALPWLPNAFQPARPGFASIDSPCPEERSQHSHGCILQMNTEFSSSTTTPPSPHAFILDSGATSHVVGDVSLLSSFTTITQATSAAAYYRARDGRRLAVIGVGTISCASFHLSDVMCVPEPPTGVILVSVSHLAQRGYVVTFGSGECYVQDQSTGEILGKGRLQGDDAMYHLEYLKIPSDKTISKAP